MAELTSYSNSTPVVAGDRLFGSDASGNTKNFLASAVSAFSNPKDVNSSIVTTYTFLLRDANCTIVFTGGSPATWTVPTNASVAYTIGDIILVCNSTAFTLTIAPDTGVTVNSANLVIAASDSKWLKKTGTNTWQMF